VKSICKWLIALNTVDCIATVFTISMGWGYELNPLMRWLITTSPSLFILFKLIIVNVFVMMIGYTKPSTYGLIATKAALICYCGICLLHLYNLIAIGIALSH